MLIAVATDDGKYIAPHFGRCAYFSIWQIKEGEQPKNLGVRLNKFTVHAAQNPAGDGGMTIAPDAGEIPGEEAMGFTPDQPGGGHNSHEGILEGLADVRVVISAGMGRRAVDALQLNHKDIFITDERDVEKAVQKCLEGTLESGESCGGHEH